MSLEEGVSSLSISSSSSSSSSSRLSSSSGSSPLVEAARLGIHKDVLALIQQGEDANSADSYGDTGLHVSTVYDIVLLLLKKGADPNKKNSIGSTPLHKAAQRGDVPIVKLLMKKGADPLIRNGINFLPEQLTTHRIIRKVLIGDDSYVTETLSVPKKKHGAIVMRLNTIQTETGVIIKVPGIKDNNPNILLEGRQESIETAKRLIHEAITPQREVLSLDHLAPDAVAFHTTIDKSLHSYLIGKKSATIKAVQEKFTVVVEFPPSEENSNSVTIHGRMDDIENAMTEIKRLISEKPKFRPRPGPGARKDEPTTITVNNFLQINRS